MGENKMTIDFANENVVQNISNLTITKRKEKVSKKQAYVYIKRIIDCKYYSIFYCLK